MKTIWPKLVVVMRRKALYANHLEMIAICTLFTMAGIMMGVLLSVWAATQAFPWDVLAAGAGIGIASFWLGVWVGVVSRPPHPLTPEGRFLLLRVPEVCTEADAACLHEEAREYINRRARELVTGRREES